MESEGHAISFASEGRTQRVSSQVVEKNEAFKPDCSGSQMLSYQYRLYQHFPNTTVLFT